MWDKYYYLNFKIIACMKKIFTLLAACFATVAGFAQNYIGQPESGQQYYITIGSNHVGYVTANEDGEKLTAQSATAALQPKQTWTATQNDDNTWTFTANVDGDTWTIYTDSDNRLHAGTAPGDNLSHYTFIFPEDEETNYASWQMLSEVPENSQAYANIYGGQQLGKEYGPWTDGSTDNGSKVYFILASEVEIPTWNFDFKTFDASDNSSRYFIEFNRDRTTNPSNDGGPKGIGGLTGVNLVLGCNGDTLVADSVIANDPNIAHKIWHINNFNAELNQIELQNEAGQYIAFKDLDEAVPGGNEMFIYDETTGTYVRTGKSGGGNLTSAWMASSDKDDASNLFVFASNQGSECYAIGDDEEGGQNFINAWGNVGWHHFMGKWTQNDVNCALKFVPITEVYSDSEMPELPKTGISTISTAKKAVDGTVYTIDGRVAGKSLNGLAKGLYIVNGKKVVK